jgi:hypothetical protein
MDIRSPLNAGFFRFASRLEWLAERYVIGTLANVGEQRQTAYVDMSLA